jgi:hypothetical protein
MNRTEWLARALLITLAIPVSGCESIALMPRPHIDDIEGRRVERERDVIPESRGRDIPLESRSRELPRDEIVGTVEQVDKSRNEIRLRTTEARVVTIKYDPSTVVYSRERDVGIDALRPRDLILVRVSKTPGGEQFADLIRLNDRDDRGSKTY